MTTPAKAICAIVAVSTFAVAADKPNFSGDWRIDSDKSTFGPMPPPASLTRKVEHNDPSMTVAESRSGPQGDQTITMKYSTDGKETTNSFMGADVKCTATWDGSTLVISSKAEFGGNEIKLTNRWTLSDDGKVLTDAVHVAAPQGEVDLTYVMNKQ